MALLEINILVLMSNESVAGVVVEAEIGSVNEAGAVKKGLGIYFIVELIGF